MAELFAATHDGALAAAVALDAGRTPTTVDARITVPEAVTGIDLEVLGGITARAVKFGAGDLEPAEVDLDHERLLRLPDFLCDALAALGTDEDPELVGDVAEEWARSEELEGVEDDLLPVVRSLVELVTTAHDAGLAVYHWSAEG